LLFSTAVSNFDPEPQMNCPALPDI